MNFLPLAATVATDAVRAQFTSPAPAAPLRERVRPAPWRLALAAVLERAARALAAPAGHAALH
jgi:hypothetical protein